LVLARLGARFSEEGTADGLLTLGEVRMARGEFPEAYAAFNLLVGSQSSPGTSEYYAAQSLVGMGRNEDAIESLNQALAHEVPFPFEAAARGQLAELTQDEEN
jgi:tetratricopeptide (TPR) repeat protein